MKYKHSCIKCGDNYEDDDVDPYYCAKCNEERKAIALEVDRKIGSKPKKDRRSDLQIAEEMGKTIKSAHPHGGSATFVRASDLGINF